jgi:hypothetical protein
MRSLARRLFLLRKKIIGDLSNTERLLVGLDLKTLPSSSGVASD